MSSQAQARQRIYQLEAAPFEDIGQWVESFERLWGDRLDSLGDFLNSMTHEKKDDG